MRSLLALAMAISGVACGPKDQKQAVSSEPALNHPEAKASAQARASSQASAQSEKAPPPPEPWVLPEWPALAIEKAPKPPPVTSYERAKEPTFVIFFGTWCGGCVISVLADAALAKEFAPKVRVGIALMADTDQKFASFARGLKVPLSIPVWRDNPATRELKELCDVHGLPIACLVDADHKVLWRGDPGSGKKILTALAQGRLDAAAAEYDGALDLLEKAKESTDTALRAKAVTSAAGHPLFENEIAWPLVEKGKSLEFAAALARDAVVETGGLEYPVLDTYAFGLWKLGHRDEALAAAKRGMDICDALAIDCPEERKRYEEFKTTLGK